MACRLCGAKPSSEPTLAYCQLDPKVQISLKLKKKIRISNEICWSWFAFFCFVVFGYHLMLPILARPQFYQTRSAWSNDQGSTKKRSAVHNFVPTVTKFCVMWEGLSLPQDTKFGNCRDEIVDRRVIFIWSLIHGSSWSGLIKVGPGLLQ